MNSNTVANSDNPKLSKKNWINNFMKIASLEGTSRNSVKIIVGLLVAGGIASILSAFLGTRTTEPNEQIGLFWSEFLLSLGTLLIGISTTYWIVNIVIQRINDNDETRNNGIDYETVAKKILSQDYSNVRIMTTAYDFLNEKLIREEDKLVQENFLNGLEKAIQKSRGTLRVRMLFLDPYSLAAIHREEGYVENVTAQPMPVPDQIRENLRTVSQWYEDRIKKLDQKQNVQIRVFDALPPFSLTSIGSKYNIVVFFQRGRRLRESRNFQYIHNTEFSRYVDETFDDIWFNARDIQEYLRLKVSFEGKEWNFKFSKSKRKFLLAEEHHSSDKIFYLACYSGDDEHKDFVEKTKKTTTILVNWRSAGKPQEVYGQISRILLPGNEGYDEVIKLFQEKYGQVAQGDRFVEISVKR